MLALTMQPRGLNTVLLMALLVLLPCKALRLKAMEPLIAAVVTVKGTRIWT
ncbi:hypothetical protein AAZX31_20G024000 [Glycine max]|nr:hypothetical protein GLYMA_20G026250v4 [Glycine max]KAH1034239.1 hypothetical protein GYH30_054579 [Glycine max]